MSSLKFIFVITPNTQTPSFRYRLSQYIPFLERLGFKVEVFERQTITPADIGNQENSLEKAAIIFLQKKLLNRSESSLLGKWRKKMVLDLDDALFIPAFDTGGKILGTVKRSRKWNKFVRTLESCSQVICANSYLAEKCREAGHNNIHVIPTPVPLDRYHAKSFESPEQGSFILGWIGTPGNLRYLEPLRPVLGNLHRKLSVILRIISSERPAITECPLEFKKWRLEEEADDLAGLDVGLMPLTDDAWTRGKAGFKLLQYMAAGLPSVSSNVGMNREIIQNGKNGFLVENASDWQIILEELACDPALCKRTGQNARKTVENQYCLDVIVPRIVDIFHQFVRNRD